MNYTEMSKKELLALQEQYRHEYYVFKSRGLKLDMSRGKPTGCTPCMEDGLPQSQPPTVF